MNHQTIASDLQELRRLRGIQIAKSRRIIESGDHWLVNTRGSRKYKVVLDAEEPTCTCPDFATNRKTCKHIYAVEHLTRLRTTKRKSGFVRYQAKTAEDPIRPTYRQNWPAYNKAQTNEEAIFLKLLHDLCKGLASSEKKMGRPPVQLADAIFASTYKVYSTFSGRRFMTALRSAHEKGHVTKVISYNSISKQMRQDELTQILVELVEKSSLPMRLIDKSFAVDSTGIGTSKFVRWFSVKHGREQDNHDWVKLHIACGVVTNVIAAVEISDRTKHDAPFLPSLVNVAKRNFEVEEVSADKGYISRKNLLAIEGIGADPYVMFKSHHTGRGTPSGREEGCELWNKAWHYFNLERDAFVKHYHKRSNVESTFHMIKSKFGQSVRSRTDVSQVNEALCKVLCHNICVTIQTMFEYGVVPSFLKEQEEER